MTMPPVPNSLLRNATAAARRLPAALLAAAAVLLVPGLLEAQAAETRGMRDFWHVFAAYAVAWALVFGWAVSIARRLRRVEERLEG